MYPIGNGDFNQSQYHCLKWYPFFREGADVLKEYYRIAEKDGNRKRMNLVNDSNYGEMVTEHVKNVFGTVFQKDKEKLKAVMLAASKWEEYEKMISGSKNIFWPEKISQFISHKSEWISSDVETWTLTLAFGYLYRIKNEAKDEGKDEAFKEIKTNAGCPRCSTKPHYGMLHSEEGYRELECWLCGHRWTVERITCPYCFEKEQSKLGFFQVDEIPGVRVYICHQCKQYVKVFDFREVEGFRPLLPLYHFATLVIDDLAVNEGFLPGSELVWSESVRKSENWRGSGK
ncbi:MAG: formate dehydrogenase accessory protein FdhE [Tindallia sp. MSAO_Bac2]|nr:MAG: formate dehydrogenase accessory protein FdhE [Tindallia sp. MSAO_Bac2]